MNIRVLYNRLETWPSNNGCVHIVLDISPEAAKSRTNEPIPADSEDPDSDEPEFMESYGKEIFPTGFKKIKKKM